VDEGEDTGESEQEHPFREYFALRGLKKYHNISVTSLFEEQLS
jgi:hypothetical protein